ncbi:class I SAM-dependent methyltransferase [Dickeya fangzhongdai]|uniref:SAM-dependent methyltransferase n=1 Tax=Dickeya fangzhongdai TaxID=1778540 RepID=A0A2K8QLU8_9GAMM|nr:class I SAM-dependent methyltransferase [Dickeya fangzhongdai]ATZ94499.1 SAM-dependent methyltransferase [Dickeya fangzhongdai]AYH48173.1 SAM-dependent methyltransferase [Dickeya fangzhongdai]QOH47937.1 class I SAM-dependent methyltransferase [Dickeya fangzhongdai]QOH52242.1 class I SAM-dependent methyltransferase [Dickeya fangzhongdai]ULR29153.1 class I SAM-dependent methyltransferase [Dickeya fangzhongdai]
MESSKSHQQSVEQQFGEQASAYLNSAVHAQGEDLAELARRLQGKNHASVLDLGCGAGHVSFTVASLVGNVVACDLSPRMLDVVASAAQEKGLTNIRTQQAVAESLPFADGSFDVVISRYSAHHWQDVGQALREVRRVLKPGGEAILMDVVSPGHPVLDVYLQTVEMLRDTSHVRDYTPGEWLTMLSEAGLTVRSLQTSRLHLEFQSWVTRMRTPEHFVTAIRALQQQMSAEVTHHYDIRQDGSFTTDIAFIVVSQG